MSCLWISRPCWVPVSDMMKQCTFWTTPQSLSQDCLADWLCLSTHGNIPGCSIIGQCLLRLGAGYICTARGRGGIHLQRPHEVLGSKPVTSRSLGWCRRGRASMLKAMDAQFAHQRFQSLNNRNKWCLFYGRLNWVILGVLIWKYWGIICGA